MSAPLVSLIMPVYNAAQFLEETFASILNQRGIEPAEVEISIYNDKSTDNSAELIEVWKSKFEQANFQVVLGTNDGTEGKGCGFAKNKSIIQSHGRYLCFLDADDVMYPDRISAQLQVALKQPLAIVGSNFTRIPEDATTRYADWCNRLSERELYLQRFREVTVIQPTWFMARSTFDRVGAYEKEMLLPEDLIFFYRHLSLGGALAKVPRPLLKYRWHEGMTSHRINRKTLMKYRVEAFEKSVLSDPKWATFTIWSAGRDGKQFYKTLREENQRKVLAFCDVNAKKIGTSIVLNHLTKHSVPIRHWNEIQPPFVSCVALDRFEEFEANLKSKNFTEGDDYYHLV